MSNLLTNRVKHVKHVFLGFVTALGIAAGAILATPAPAMADEVPSICGDLCPRTAYAAVDLVGLNEYEAINFVGAQTSPGGVTETETSTVNTNQLKLEGNISGSDGSCGTPCDLAKAAYDGKVSNNTDSYSYSHAVGADDDGDGVNQAAVGISGYNVGHSELLGLTQVLTGNNNNGNNQPSSPTP